MAGGAGERFWPLSRRHRPKQLLRLTSGRTLLEEAVERIVALTGYENLYVATGADQAPLVRKALPRLAPENVLAEPMGRDTAACLALALAKMSRRGGDPTMAVMTADHSIGPPERFSADCTAAFEQAEAEDVLLTFGIQPTRPDTGFGYIELGEKIAERKSSEVFKVVRFREKPNEETARQFLAAGHFLWNSGMFVWRTSVLRKAMEECAPRLAEASDEIASTLDEPDEDERLFQIFNGLSKTSIDYAIMERAANVQCVRATFEWDDIGTWSALARHRDADMQGNVVVGEALALETKGSIIFADTGDESGKTPLVATFGVEDLVVVATDDAVLVCHRSQAQRVKEITQKLREHYGKKYS
jgi:mannose-1-phosphate guanylyltransferase